MIIPENLYWQIVTVMPIPCVDLLVENDSGEVLLLRRINEPARDEWWFPGGRVHLGEPRQRAAARKLLEECGLTVSELQESGTFDVIFPQTSWGAARHGITTLYHARVPNGLDVTIDSQSLEARWRSPAAWLETPLSLFVRERLRAFQEASHA